MKHDITRLLTLIALLGLMTAPLAKADETAKEEPKQEAPADSQDEKPADEKPADSAEQKE